MARPRPSVAPYLKRVISEKDEDGSQPTKRQRAMPMDELGYYCKQTISEEALAPCDRKQFRYNEEQGNVGREIRMLREAKCWRVGDLFGVAREAQSTFALDSNVGTIGMALRVNKNLEGQQWEWTGRTVELANVVDERSVQWEYVEALKREKEFYHGRCMRFLKSGRLWKAGAVNFVIDTKAKSFIVNDGRSVIRASEGVEFEWTGEIADSEACHAELIRRRGLMATMTPAEFEPFLDREVRMLDKTKDADQGEIFRIMGYCGTAFKLHRQECPFKIRRDGEGLTWEWADTARDV